MLDIPELTQALYEIGFKLQSDQDSLKYSGDLNCHGNPVPIILEITDLDLIELPKIKLERKVKTLPEFCSHISGDTLCYLQEGHAYLDRYDPIPSIIGCLDLAKKLLEKLIAGDPLEDTVNEFASYWCGDVQLFDLAGSEEGDNELWKFVLNRDDDSLIIWGFNLIKLEEKYKYIGKRGSAISKQVYICNTQILPFVIEKNWPPESLNDFIKWLKIFDNDVHKDFSKCIQNAHASESRSICFLVKNPSCWFGATFDIPKMFFDANYRQASLFKQQVFKNSKKIKITRIQPIRIDHDYIVNRNLLPGSKNLANKNILVIGCGAIGGFLADLLCRYGAGISGELEIIDDDILMPGNLTRHYLGIEYLFQSKVAALSKELKRKYPGININPFNAKAQEVLNFKNVDIIFDATGSEAFSNWLNEQWLANNFPPIIYSWIVGNGIATQSFLQDKSTKACYKCLRINDFNSGHIPIPPRHEVYRSNSGGCDSLYVPFSSAAPMHAAALSVEIALDLLNSTGRPYLRTVVVDNKQGQNIKNQNPKRWKQCPACH